MAVDGGFGLSGLMWFPEPYARSGGLAAAGFYKLLGRPRLDPLTVLVRETAQNSWDARQPDETVRYFIDGWALWDSELDTLREKVFRDRGSVNTGLKEALAQSHVHGLFIADRGTRGLGGPLTADDVSASGIYDWVDFVLNVGKPNEQGLTGGTYGFGKTITYIVSSVNAIVIHSRTMHKNRPQTRLMACAIGPEFKRGGKLFTGRHWWGRPDMDDPVPLTGSAADAIASEVGMPPFGDGELGTNILVVAPDFAGRSPEQAMRFIAESVTWHLWPKLIQHGGRRPMDVEVNWNGDPVPVPEPDDRPPLHGFAQAFRALLDDVSEGRRADGLERVAVRCQRPKVDVGDLVTVPLVVRARAEIDDGHDPSQPDTPPSSAVIMDVCHHVALLRVPELVVDYQAGPVPVDGGTEWAAVFRCRPEVDGHFALAEPPTHDRWSPELLDKGQAKTIVKVGLQNITRFLEDRWGAARSAPTVQTAGSTAVIADDLAHLVGAMPATGLGREPGPGGGTSPGPPGAKVEILRTSVALVEGNPATVFRLGVQHRVGSRGTRLRIAAGVGLDDAGSDPELDPNLRLIYIDPTDGLIRDGERSATLEILGPDAGEVEVWVGRSDDIAVSLEVTTEVLASA